MSHGNIVMLFLRSEPNLHLGFEKAQYWWPRGLKMDFGFMTISNLCSRVHSKIYFDLPKGAKVFTTIHFEPREDMVHLAIGNCLGGFFTYQGRCKIDKDSQMVLGNASFIGIAHCSARMHSKVKWMTTEAHFIKDTRSNLDHL